MEKKYFVTYAINEYSGLNIGSIEITTLEMKVKDMSPGQLAEYLEMEISDALNTALNTDIYNDVTIINYWEV